MKFLDELKSKLTQRAEDSGYLDVEDDGYDYGSNAVTEQEAYENDHYGETEGVSHMNIRRIPAGNLNIIQPTCVQDVIHEVVDLLRNDCIVILNLTKIDANQRIRIVDFVSGVVAAIDGSIVEASPFTYTATPKSITVSTESQTVEGVDSYMNGTNS